MRPSAYALYSVEIGEHDKSANKIDLMDVVYVAARSVQEALAEVKRLDGDVTPEQILKVERIGPIENMTRVIQGGLD